jgi:hypothetical protein
MELVNQYNKIDGYQQGGLSMLILLQEVQMDIEAVLLVCQIRLAKDLIDLHQDPGGGVCLH